MERRAFLDSGSQALMGDSPFAEKGWESFFPWENALQFWAALVNSEECRACPKLSHAFALALPGINNTW